MNYSERSSPLVLFLPERLDLVVKARFFRHLRDGGDPDSERVYRWHVEQRTGGREPRSWKQSVDDYLHAAAELLASMGRHGFDPQCQVPVGVNGILRNGAHRVACAYVLGEKINIAYAHTPSGAAPWGEQWFASQGFAPADLAQLIHDWNVIHAETSKHSRAIAAG